MARRRTALTFITVQFLLALVTNVQAQKKQPVHLNVYPDGESYKGQIQFGGSSYPLNLKPDDDPVLLPNFKLSVTKTDPQGNVIIEDWSPSRDELKERQSSFYTDEKSKAVFRIQRSEEGIQMNGFLNKAHISYDGKSHYIVSYENLPEQNPEVYKFVGTNLTVPSSWNPVDIPQSRQSQGTTYPELYLVLDYRQFNNLGRNRNNVIDYVQVFVRSVNTHYFTMKDPAVKFVVTGVTCMWERAHQPFMEQSKSGDGSATYDMPNVLDKFAKYMYTYRKDFAGHDVSSLLSSEEFKYKDENGNWAEGMLGITYVAGACQVNDANQRSYKTAVVADPGAFWRGVFSLGHELGHLMGAHHDGEGNSKSCSWDEGYAMSYARWGTPRKYYWSPCSANSIKALINSPQGACLRSYQHNEVFGESKQYAGDRYDLNAQCQRFTGRSDCRHDPSSVPEEICSNLRCTYIATCQSGSGSCNFYVTTNVQPFDSSPCGGGNKCFYGRCIRP